MFRAIAAQLGQNQEKMYPLLRKSAVKWMCNHEEELLAGGLLDCPGEAEEYSKDGVWANQAALVALANVLDINIAVIQGGDRGVIDIQHITPFETSVTEGIDNGIMLAYLYDGHYDAVSSEADTPNPEYKEWVDRVRREVDSDEQFARALDEEEQKAAQTDTVETPGNSDETVKRFNEHVTKSVPNPSDPSDLNKNYVATLDKDHFVGLQRPSLPSSTFSRQPVEPSVETVRHLQSNAATEYLSRDRTVPVRTEWSGSDVPYLNSTTNESRTKIQRPAPEYQPPPPRPIQRERTKVRIIPVTVPKTPRYTRDTTIGRAAGRNFTNLAHAIDAEDELAKAFDTGLPPSTREYSSSRPTYNKPVAIPVYHESSDRTYNSGYKSGTRSGKYIPSNREPERYPAGGGSSIGLTSYRNSPGDSGSDYDDLSDWADVQRYVGPSRQRYTEKELQQRLYHPTHRTKFV